VIFFAVLISSGYRENRHKIKAMCICYGQNPRERKVHEKEKELRKTAGNCMKGFQQDFFRKS